VIVDSGLVTSVPETPGIVNGFPITDIAVKATGRSISANVVALGVLNTVAGLVSPESLEKAVSARVPGGTAKINLAALGAGIEAAAAAGV
jgi:2-oxoglutarate ferredoxin oxidoreductase subunit gamma